MTGPILEEVKEKELKVKEYMNKHDLDGVLISKGDSWAWITGGINDRIVYTTETSWIDILITKDLEKFVICSNVEKPRVEEELTELGYEIKSFPWYEEKKREEIINNIINNNKFASDSGFEKTVDLGDDFYELRYSLTEREIEKFRLLGEWTREAIEDTCRELQRGMTEWEIFGLAAGKMCQRGIFPSVLMVGSDERIFKFRHPLTTDKKVDKYVMILTCAMKWGLILNMTRLVHFGEISEELKQKIRKVTEIDAKLIYHSNPDHNMQDFNKIVADAYSEAGYPGMWEMHYQGGPAGYGPREYEWDPSSNKKFYNNQAIAWNPTITGVKVEDTFITKDGKVEFISMNEKSGWPLISHKIEETVFNRPDILIRED